MNSKEFHTSIHTMQIRSNEALLDLDTIKRKPYVKSVRFEENVLYTLNPNKFSEEPLNTIADYKLALRSIVEDLCISEYKLARVDIAISSKIIYEQPYKLNKYIAELFALHTRNKNGYKADGLLDLKKRSITVGSRSFELEIYDKDLESNGRDSDKTRIEFRYKRIGKGKDENCLVRNLITVINQLPLYIEELTKYKTDVLYSIWDEESRKGYVNTPVSNFSEFCRRYGNEIYNTQILKALYKKINDGNYKNWIKRFRRNNKIVCYSKAQVKTYLQELKTALHSYIDGGTFSTQNEQEF